MSIIGLVCLLLGLVAVLFVVLYFLQRRELSAVEQLSQQVQRIAIGGRLSGRVDARLLAARNRGSQSRKGAP